MGNHGRYIEWDVEFCLRRHLATKSTSGLFHFACVTHVRIRGYSANSKLLLLLLHDSVQYVRPQNSELMTLSEPADKRVQ
jgi:hypothetical protein